MVLLCTVSFDSTPLEGVFSTVCCRIPECITSGVALERLADRVSGMQLLWRYNKEAVALCIAFFTGAPLGGMLPTACCRTMCCCSTAQVPC